MIDIPVLNCYPILVSSLSVQDLGTKKDIRLLVTQRGGYAAELGECPGTASTKLNETLLTGDGRY